MALKRLKNEYTQYLKESTPYYSICPTENFFVWNVLIFGPEDTLFEGGIFEGQFRFTKDYPVKAPEFKIITPFFHPNVYTDGRVCMSILHEGIDEFGYEILSERWNPSHSVNSVLLSLLLLLAQPNFESPANVDASVLCKNNYNDYKKLVYSIVARTQN
jgi:ubiquitin-protein ligase